MKITDVSTRLIDQYMFVRVDTDEGISGVGESGSMGLLRSLRGSGGDLQTVSDRTESSFDRAPLAVYVPVLPL